MDFPNEYIERAPAGEPFRLRSGGESMVRYDVNAMLMDPVWRERIVENIPDSPHYVGIVTGGAIIAVQVADESGRDVSMIKDGELKGMAPTGRCLVIDDVCTTERSLRETREVLVRSGVRGDKIYGYVVVDRRPKGERFMPIGSLFDLPDK